MHKTTAKNESHLPGHEHEPGGEPIPARPGPDRKALLRLAAAALLFGMGAIVVLAFMKLDSSKKAEVSTKPAEVAGKPAAADNDPPAVSAPSPLLSQPQQSGSGRKRIDYSRPPEATTGKSNAPVSDDQPFQLTDDPRTFEYNLEAQLVAIVQTSGPDHIPSVWAHSGRVTNNYGRRRNPFGGASYEFHFGMDIGGDTGDAIVSPAKGRILRAQWHGGYGNFIEITHGNGLTTRYGHLSKIAVVVGEPVERGQLIGFVGSTGRSTGPHLHYETRLHGKPFNPRRFLSFGPAN